MLWVDSPLSSSDSRAILRRCELVRKRNKIYTDTRFFESHSGMKWWDERIPWIAVRKKLKTIGTQLCWYRLMWSASNIFTLLSQRFLLTSVFDIRPTNTIYYHSSREKANSSLLLFPPYRRYEKRDEDRFTDRIVKRIFSLCIESDTDYLSSTRDRICLMKSSNRERNLRSNTVETRFFGFFLTDQNREEIKRRQ